MGLPAKAMRQARRVKAAVAGRVVKLPSATRRAPTYYTRNRKVFARFKERSSSLPGREEISGHPGHISVRRTVGKGGEERFTAMVERMPLDQLLWETRLFKRHEAAHVAQAIFLHRMGIKLDKRSPLAHLHELWIRFLGFNPYRGNKDGNPFEVPLARRKRMSLARIRLNPHDYLDAEIPRYFSNPRSFLRGLVALHRSRSMRSSLRVLNDEYVPELTATMAYHNVVSFFEGYLRDHPQG